MLWGGLQYRGGGTVVSAAEMPAVKRSSISRRVPGVWPGLALLLLVAVVPAHTEAAGTARVTHDGTVGIRTQVLDICTGCHSAGALQTPYMETFTQMNAATPNAVGYCTGLTVAQCGNLRVQDDSMPVGGIGDPALKSLMQSWINDGILQRAAPLVNSSAATSITKYSATLNASVNENGADSTFYFDYGIGSFTSASSTTTASGTGGAGSASTTTINRAISGLSCGSSYQFRARGSNAAGSNIASTLNFNTLACPTISNIANQTINEDSATGALAFSLTDNGSGVSCTNLSVSASSSNTTLVPNANISLAGSGCNRTISVTPAANLSGSTTITVSVDDEDAGTGANVTDTFTVTVNAVNDEPSISDISNQGTSEDVGIGPINFTVSDVETAAGSLLVSASSSNQTLLPNANITLGGSNGSRTISLTPALDQTGSATVTVSVSDGVDSAADTFTLVVAGVNDNPTISDISNQAGTEDTSNQVAFTISDAETAPGSLLLSASSSNTALVPNANLVFGGSGANRTLTATPVANASGSATITIVVQDELFASASDSYVLTITAVNDAPALSAIANGTVTELSPFARAVSVTDPDDANDGSGALTFSLQGAPAGMVISSTGAISWTPGQNTAGSYPIIVRVEDGGEDGAAASTAGFTLTVEKLDSDSDTVADYLDNCPNTANTDQANNDGDSNGDACDSDDDNDGLPDTIELARGLDPFDASDAAGDLDGDGLSNLEEYQTCVAANDPVCDAIAVDSVAPVINTNGDLIIASTGYVTAAGETATAEDGVDGPVAVSADISGPFRPGLHTITWTAQDAAGNTATAEQIVQVLPQAEIAGHMLVGEDQLVRVPILLNGDAPSYPLYLVYSVAGTASGADHNLVAGSIAVTSGDRAYLEFSVLPDGSTEADETVLITLTSVTSNGVLGVGRQATVTIVDRPAPPQLQLQLQQAGETTQAVFADLGEVTITALATDANSDVLSYLWQLSDDSVSVDIEGNVLRFDPQAVAPGTYVATVTVADADHAVTQQLPFTVSVQAPVLLDTDDTDGDGVDDLAEGVTDSDGDGVVDYLDPVHASHQLQLVTTGSQSMQRLLLTDAGLRLSIGERALAASRRGAVIRSSDVTDEDGNVIADPTHNPIGELYDFRVSGLTELNPDARVIIPLLQSLPPAAVYRKFIDGSWQSFSTAGGDEIHSADRADNGLCPALDDEAWQPGLNTSHRCLRLRIRDGGRNDADGVINGEVTDPGAVAIAKASDEPTEPTDGPNGGGGAMWLGTLAGLLIALSWRQRKLKEHKA